MLPSLKIVQGVKCVNTPKAKNTPEKQNKQMPLKKSYFYFLYIKRLVSKMCREEKVIGTLKTFLQKSV